MDGEHDALEQDRLLFKQAADLAFEWAPEALLLSQIARRALDFPCAGHACVAWDPETEKVACASIDSSYHEHHGLIMRRLREAFGEDRVSSEPPDNFGDLIKLAYSQTLRGIGEATNLLPGHYPGGIPNHAGPLAATLTGGLIGAGLGYGSSLLPAWMLPEDWDREKLKRNMTILGAGVGATPGLLYGLTNKMVDKDFNDNSLLADKQADAERVENALSLLPPKTAGLLEGSGVDSPAAFSVPQFTHTIWGDPYVADRLSPAMQGAASGAVMTAQHLPGGVGPGWVTPTQMGHLALNMGGSALSGRMVGTALSILAGAPPHVRDDLARTGMYAGFITTLVPHLFGR